MREIEVKARIKDINKVVAALQNKGCYFEKEIEQIDKIFLHKSLDYSKVGPGVPVARIRSSRGKHIFTVKIPVKNRLDKFESETELDNPGQMLEALKLMDFFEVMTIKKKRLKTKLSGDEVCIDQVENLGNFIEMERLTDDNVQPEEVQKELFNLLESIGVEGSARVFEGYDVLLYKSRLN